MSYTPTVWADNDDITVQKLNKMEQGLKEQVEEIFIVNITEEWNEGASGYYTDKTYAEIKEAFLAGKTLMVKCEDLYGYGYYIAPILTLIEKVDEYSIVFIDSLSRNEITVSSSSNNTILSYIEEVIIT